MFRARWRAPLGSSGTELRPTPRPHTGRNAACVIGLDNQRPIQACPPVPARGRLWLEQGAEPGTHMWTAPVSQGRWSCDGSGRLRSYVRPPAFARAGFCGAVGVSAGPDGFRGSGPEQEHDVGASLGSAGCPDPRIDRSPSRCVPCKRQSCPRKRGKAVSASCLLRFPVDLAAHHHGPDDAGMAQMMRAWPR